MIAFTFLFANDPTAADVTGEGQPLKISVFAECEVDAWQTIEGALDIPSDNLRILNPTIQIKDIRRGEIAISRQPSLATLDDPWPAIVTHGVSEVTKAITDVAGGAHTERVGVELEGLKIERLIILVISIAFLGGLAFSFYLMASGQIEALSRFLFPIMTAVLGLIGGYLGGRGSGSRGGRR